MSSDSQRESQPELLAVARTAAAGMAELWQTALALQGVGSETGGEVEVAWRPGMSADDLAEAVDTAAAELASEFREFRRGHVYCYACQSAVCVHSRPATDEQVFAGYEATGTARWIELFSLLLNLGDRRTDLLFAKPAKILARFVDRQALIESQLVSFGRHSMSYRLWGQVVAGYLPGPRSRAALTAQLVETRDHRLHLQVIAPPAVLEALAEAEEHPQSPLQRIHEALAEASRRLATLGDAWCRGRTRELKARVREQAYAELRHLAASIERKGRQEQKRTRHAEERGAQMRPVHKAGADVDEAADGNFYRDVVKDVVVVASRAGRVHVFARDGRHVTSLTLGGDELERRVRRRRYQPLAGDEVVAARKAIGGE